MVMTMITRGIESEGTEFKTQTALKKKNK